LTVSTGAVGLVVAVEIATIEGSEIPVVALLRPFAPTVAADRLHAGRIRSLALESTFELAFGRTAIVIVGVPIVALLEPS
jgi:hypothetical protein